MYRRLNQALIQIHSSKNVTQTSLPKIIWEQGRVAPKASPDAKVSHRGDLITTAKVPLDFPIVKIGEQPPKVPFPLHDVNSHLIHMPRPTPRTTPNRSSEGSRTLAQLRRKVPFGYNGAHHICPKGTPSCRPIAKPNYLPQPWTRPTYHFKQHPDPISRFATIYWTDRQTNRPTDGYWECLITIVRLGLYRERRGLTMHII